VRDEDLKANAGGVCRGEGLKMLEVTVCGV